MVCLKNRTIIYLKTCVHLQCYGDSKKLCNMQRFDFLWKQKPAKIKKTTLIKKKSDGGLGMKDFVLFEVYSKSYLSTFGL